MSSKPTFEPGFIEFFIALMLPLIMGGLAVLMALNIQGCSSNVEGIGYESESLKELAWNPPPGGEDETVDPSGENPDGEGEGEGNPGEPPWKAPGGAVDDGAEGELEGDEEGTYVPGACVPGTGCWGEPCEEDSDCQSDVCVIHLGEGQCSDVCDTDCPEGFSPVASNKDYDNEYFKTICLED